MSSEHIATRKSLLYTLKTKPKKVPVLRINEKKTLQLVQEFEKAQCLWNTNLIDYPNRKKRQLAYEAIAGKLNVPNFTSGHVQAKLKNLRNSYCQEVKKMATHNNYKPTVLWFETMHRFLSPHVQKINTEKIQLVQNTRQTVKVEVDADDQIETTDCVVGNPSERDTSSEDSEIPSCSGNIKHTAELNENDQVVIKRRYSETEEDLSMSEKIDDPLMGPPLLGMNEIPTASVEQTASEQNMRVIDHYDAFGTYVATLLRSLPPKKALMLQPRILNLIVEELNNDELES